MTAGPLSDLVVLDLTRARAGPTCARQFADWGADVIKIEIPAEDPAAATQADMGARHDADFQNLHRNKRSLTLDLKKPKGVEVFRRLVKRADVVVENYRPDVKFRLGIDYESLKAINKRIVYTSISGFGETGPYRDRPGVDQIAQGMSGLMSITGEPGRGPMRAGIALCDMSAGLFGALGTLVALRERDKSGEGQWVQTSLLASILFMMDFQGARYTMSGEVARQVGNDHPTGVPTGTYKTADGHINIAPTPAMWRRFCTAMGREDWINHPDYSTTPSRRKNRAQVHAMIEEITAKEPGESLIKKMNAAGIPCGPIHTIEQAFNDVQVKHLGIAQKVRSAALGDITIVAQPVTLSRTPSRLDKAAPELGEHSDGVLGDAGYSAAEIEALKGEGVV